MVMGTSFSMKWFICVGILLVKKFRASHTLCPPPHFYQTVGSKLCQNNTDYHCLYEGQTKSSQPYCFKPEIFTAGSYVLYEGGLNARPCPVNRYQPVPYMSNQYHECTYTKSYCSEEGQAAYDFASAERDPTENDRACRCDYRNGYDFISKPKHKCFCIPSEEDCSCFLKHCPDNVQRLTPDYECLTNSGLITCPVILSKQDTDREKEEQEGILQYYHNTYNVALKAGIKKFVICGAIAVLDVVLIFIGIGIVFCHKTQPKQRGQVATLDILESPNFIGSSSYRRCIDVLKTFNFVVIKGRFGSGKTTIAHQLALHYIDHNKITITKKHLDQFMSLKPSKEKQVVIFDEVCTLFDSNESQTMVGKCIESCLAEDTSVVIVTVGEFEHTLIRFLRTRSIISSETMIDLNSDSQMSKNEKLLLLNTLLRQQNMKRRDLNLEVFQLSEEESDKITSVDTFWGFPYLCAEFCKHSFNFQLGVKYFKQPPKKLIGEIERVRTSGNGLDQDSRVLYAILAYILLCKDVFIDLNELNVKLLKEIKGYSFKLNLPERELFRYLRIKDTSLERYVRHLGDGKFSLHPTVYQAMILSFAKIKFNAVINKCRLEDLLDLIRPPGYNALKNEIALVCSKEQYDVFCKEVPARMAVTSLIDNSGVNLVCQYVSKYPSKKVLLNYLNKLSEEFYKCITSQRVELIFSIFKDIVIENKIIFLELDAKAFNTVWALLVCNKSSNTNLLDDMIRKTISKADKTFIENMLCTLIDENDNNMLTYCTLLWENRKVQSLIAILSNIFSVEHCRFSVDRLFKTNKQGICSIHFAAYYGRYKCLTDFLALKVRKASKAMLEKAASHKLRDEIRGLIELTKNGEQGLPCEQIQFNRNICGKIQMGTNDDFVKTLKVLEIEIQK